MWNVVIVSKWHVNQGIFINLEKDLMKVKPITIFIFFKLFQKEELNQVKYNNRSCNYIWGTYRQHLL